MKKFVRKITTPSNAGREKGGSSRSSCSSDVSGEPSPPAPGAHKRRAESPTESLAPSEIDNPSQSRRAGAEKTARKPLTSLTPDRQAQCAGVSEGPGDSDAVRQIKGLFETFQGQFRSEFKNIIEETLGPRLDSLEKRLDEQRQDINRLSAENRRLKAAVEKCNDDVGKADNGAKSAIVEMKKTFADITARHPAASPNSAATSKYGLSEDTLRDLVAEASEQQNRVNNVILRGVQELPSENLSAIIGTLAPQLAPEDIKSAARLGPSHSSRPRDETSSSRAGAKPAPRLVRVVLSPQGKNLLLRNKTSAQYKGDNVYIQHDLTRQEQRRRKDLVPKFRALRDKGVRCHLPRDKIINNGAPLSSDDITRLLNTVTQ